MFLRVWHGERHQTSRLRRQVLIRCGLEFLRAPGAAEIIGRAAVLNPGFGIGWIDHHPAYRISGSARVLRRSHLHILFFMTLVQSERGASRLGPGT